MELKWPQYHHVAHRLLPNDMTFCRMPSARTTAPMPPSAHGAYRERRCGDRPAQPRCRPDAPLPARSQRGGTVATSSAHVLKVARKPWAVIGRPLAGSSSSPLFSPELTPLTSRGGGVF